MRQLCAGLREPSTSATATASESSAGIVTTLKDVGATLAAWCTFHLASGFVHLYLYFDDPAELRVMEPLLSHLRRRWQPARISATAVDDALRAEWRTLPRADAYLAHAPSEVQVRQQLNATHAMARAVRDGLAWLLHIDGDELFCCRGCDAAAHFGKLSRLGAHAFNYINHEVVQQTHTSHTSALHSWRLGRRRCPRRRRRDAPSARRPSSSATCRRAAIAPRGPSL